MRREFERSVMGTLQWIYSLTSERVGAEGAVRERSQSDGGIGS